MSQIEEFRKLVWKRFPFLIISLKCDFHVVYYINSDDLDGFVESMDRELLDEYYSLESLVDFIEREIEQSDKEWKELGFEQEQETDELVKWIEKYRAKGLITDEGAVQTND